MISKGSHPSPLRYPGGKLCLNKMIKDTINVNNLRGIDYAEPFAGGAALALSLLFEGYVSYIYLNDLDTSIYAFWTSILEETDDFCELIKQTPITLEQWHMQKKVYTDPVNSSLLELGFATFFLNRTNRSGIITGGVIGGLNQNGKYKLDCRFNKEDLINKIRNISLWKNNIVLSRLDARQFMREVICDNPNDCLTFIDPPYYNKGPKLYYNALNHMDHVELSEIIQNDLTGWWIVTYDDVPDIHSMYSNSLEVPYTINYSLSTKRKGKEIMYHSSNLSIPTF